MPDVIDSLLEARDAYDKLQPDERAAVNKAVAAGQDRIAAVNAARTRRAGDVARTAADSENDLREPTFGEKAASYGEGLASSLGAGLAPLAMGLGAGVSAPTNQIDAFKWAYNKQKAAQDDADAQAPAAAGAGHLTGDAANALMALAGPVKSGATAAEDLAAGAKPSEVFSTGLAPLVQSVGRAGAKIAGAADNLSPVARSGLALATFGKSEAAILAAKQLAKLKSFGEAISPLVSSASDIPAEVMAGASKAAPGAFAMPESVMSGDADIGKLVDRSASDIVDQNAAWDDFAERLDPKGADFKAWLRAEDAPRIDRPDLDRAAKILETKTGASGSVYQPEGVGTPSTPLNLRAQALDEIAKDTHPPEMPADVMAGSPGKQPISSLEDLTGSPPVQALAEAHRPQWELDAVAAFKNAAGNPDQYRAVSEWLTQNGVDLGTQARLGEEAGTIDSSLELPMRRPRAIDVSSAPKPTSADELKAEVAAAVQRGEPLKALAERLGVNQGDLNAWYKSAQVGNLGVRPPGILRFTSDGTPIDEELESQIAMERARAPDAPADTEDFRLPPIEPPPPAFQDTRPMVRWTTSRAPAQLLPQNWVANDSDLRLSMTDQVWRTQQADRAAEAELAAERARAAAESGGTNPGRAGARRGVDGPASTGRMLSRGELRQMIRDFTKDGSDVDVEKLVDEIIRSRGGK